MTNSISEERPEEDYQGPSILNSRRSPLIETRQEQPTLRFKKPRATPRWSAAAANELQQQQVQLDGRAGNHLISNQLMFAGSLKKNSKKQSQSTKLNQGAHQFRSATNLTTLSQIINNNELLASGNGQLSTFSAAGSNSEQAGKLYERDSCSASQPVHREQNFTMGQYSSSQAQLQSLTADFNDRNSFSPVIVNYSSSIGDGASSDHTLRKTPKQYTSRQQQHLRQLRSIAGGGEPMASQQQNQTTISTNELSQSAAPNCGSRLQQQQQQRSSISCLPGSSQQQHPVGVSSSSSASTNNGTGNNNRSSPSLATTPAGLPYSHNLPLPPPYEQQAAQISISNNGNANANNVICQQPSLGHRYFNMGDINRTGDNNNLPPALSAPISAPSASQHQVLNFFSQQQVASNYSLQQQFSGNHHHQQQQATLLSQSSNLNLKSRSCLTCSDFSVKWYIVVIALLGLICALIGTIVGAVHSVGRDYISLALLLLGVGLVLIAISWVALRITIKTYKTNTNGGSPQSAAQRINQRVGQPAMSLLRSRQQQQPVRLSGAASQSQMHRSLLNERLYMMAAAAAAAAAISSRQPQPAPAPSRRSSSPSQDHQQQSDSNQPGGLCCQASSSSQQPANQVGFMSSVKRRLPRRLARLLPSQTGSSSSSPQISSPAQDPSAATAAAAAALLQQYQAALLAPPHHAAAVAAAAALLFPPQHPNYFGVSPSDLANFRPPPPSYSAAMQEQRIRMLHQERNGLQQMQNSINSNGQHQPAPPVASSQAQSAQTPAPTQLQNNQRHQMPQALDPVASANHTTILIGSEGGQQNGGDGIPINNIDGANSDSGDSSRQSIALKPSSSSPVLPTNSRDGEIVTNDIYVSSASCSSAQSQIVNQAASHTVVNITRRETSTNQGPSDRVMILGYL